LQECVQKGEVAVKPVGTWRNTADLSTKILGKRRIKVLLNLMGCVDTHNDYYPVGEQERLEDEQKKLEKKIVRRIQQANAKGAYKAFRILLVQALLDGGSAVAQSGLESTGLEAQCGEPTIPSRSTQMPLMWMIATCIIILALLARWAYKRLRRAQGELEQRLMNLDAHIYPRTGSSNQRSFHKNRKKHQCAVATCSFGISGDAQRARRCLGTA